MLDRLITIALRISVRASPSCNTSLYHNTHGSYNSYLQQTTNLQSDRSLMLSRESIDQSIYFKWNAKKERRCDGVEQSTQTRWI